MNKARLINYVLSIIRKDLLVVEFPVFMIATSRYKLSILVVRVGQLRRTKLAISVYY